MKGDFLEKIEAFCLFDDDFMRKCFEDSKECVELVLRIILDKPDLQVTEVRHQYQIKSLQGHSVEMDIFAVDSQGRKYNIEVQRRTTGAKPKRARYYSSVADANELQAGEDYRELPETYVIFITEKDALGYGLPLYEIDRYIGQNCQLFQDEAHILYVNGQCRDDTPLGRLMQDFACTKAEEMHYKELADRVAYLKGTEKGRKEMCEIMDEIYAEGEKAGLEMGKVMGIEQGKALGLEQGKTIGLEQGKALGLEQGKSLGIEQGKALGVEQGTRQLLFKFMVKQNQTFESACELFDIPEKEREKYREMCPF